MAKAKPKSARPLTPEEIKNRAERKIGDYNRHHKQSQILDIAEVTIPSTFLRYPFGIPSLDIATGGGVAAGSVVELVGKESLGKTALIYRCMGRYQKRYGEHSCLFGAHLESFDKVFARMMGLIVPMSDAEIKEEERHQGRKLTQKERDYLKRKVGIFHEILGGTPDILNGILELSKTNLYRLGILDSIGSLMSVEEDKEEDTTQSKYGGVSKELTQFQKNWRKNMSVPDEDGNPMLTTLMVVNQQREIMGGRGGVREPGGNALKHLKDISIRLTLEHKPDRADDPTQDTYKELRWQIQKGKAGCHDGPTGVIRFLLPARKGTGLLHIDDSGGPYAELDLVTLSIVTKVAGKNGTWLTYPKEDIRNFDPGDLKPDQVLLKAQGAENMAQLLRNDPTLFEIIKGRLFKAAEVRDYDEYLYHTMHTIKDG